jgi:DNA-binding transcriptional regulator YdaS (Cro superfamily)
MDITPADPKCIRLNRVYDALVDSGRVKNKKAMAKELGVYDSYLNTRLLGDKKIPDELAHKIEKVYGISAVWLLHGEGETPVTPSASRKDVAELSKLVEKMATEITDLKARLAKLEAVTLQQYS